MWPIAVLDARFRTYMPNNFAGGKETDRKFFWGIWTHLESELVEEIIGDITRRRHAALRPRAAGAPAVAVTEFWAGLLLNAPHRRGK